MRPVSGVRGDPNEQEHPDNGQHHADDHQRFGTDPRQELGHDSGCDDDAAAEREERETGLQRAVFQSDLEVVGEEQEHGEQPGSDEEEDKVGASTVAVQDDGQRKQGVVRAQLPDDERDQQDHRDDVPMAASVSATAANAPRRTV